MPGSIETTSCSDKLESAKQSTKWRTAGEVFMAASNITKLKVKNIKSGYERQTDFSMIKSEGEHDLLRVWMLGCT